MPSKETKGAWVDCLEKGASEIDWDLLILSLEQYMHPAIKEADVVLLADHTRDPRVAMKELLVYHQGGVKVVFIDHRFAQGFDRLGAACRAGAVLYQTRPYSTEGLRMVLDRAIELEAPCEDTVERMFTDDE